jgi:hypothetical protein
MGGTRNVFRKFGGEISWKAFTWETETDIQTGREIAQLV